MAIDWKTIISEFDGKPTLLQAIGKLRKAVEDETITIQQAQAEIAKLESQQKADEALITTAQTTANNAQSAVQATDTKAQQALDLATTNETDIGTLNGQVAALETDLNNKQDKITKATNLSCKKIKTDSLSFTMELGSDSTEYDYGLLFASKTMVSTGQLKPSFVDEQFFKWLLPAKSGTLATTDEVATLETSLNNKQDKITSITDLTAYSVTANTIRSKKELKADGLLETIDSTEYRRFLTLSAGNRAYKIVGKESNSFGVSTVFLPESKGHLVTEENLKTIFGNQSIVGAGNIDLYRHDIAVTFSSADSNDIHVEFISSKNTVCNSLQDLKTVLGDSFRISANGGVFGIFDELSTEFVAEYMRETGIQTFYKETGSDFGAKFISFADNPFSLSDTVTTI